MSSVPKIARSDDRWLPELPDLLQQAADEYDLSQRAEFQSLSDLSERTDVDAIVTYGESAVIADGIWQAPATLYVTLNYDLGGDGIHLSDTYPAQVYFSVEDVTGKVTINSIEPDVSSFYDDGDEDDADPDIDVDLGEEPAT